MQSPYTGFHLSYHKFGSRRRRSELSCANKCHTGRSASGSSKTVIYYTLGWGGFLGAVAKFINRYTTAVEAAVAAVAAARVFGCNVFESDVHELCA